VFGLFLENPLRTEWLSTVQLLSGKSFPDFALVEVVYLFLDRSDPLIGFVAGEGSLVALWLEGIRG
jgi:hypothetical protein